MILSSLFDKSNKNQGSKLNPSQNNNNNVSNPNSSANAPPAQNYSISHEYRGDISSQQQLQLIHELEIRFKGKPRACKKVNDSSIGTSKRIVYVNDATFYYYPMIQEFQDLDISMLEYATPKAAVNLEDIVALAFPPRKKAQKNYFKLTIPKNKILKYGKDKKAIVMDPTAKGEQVWTFEFGYDIVTLPQREERVERERLRIKILQQEKLQLEQREKERRLHQEAEKRLEEEERQRKFQLFLKQKEDVRKEEAQIKQTVDKQQENKKANLSLRLEKEAALSAANKRKLETAYEFHFSKLYDSITPRMSRNEILNREYEILELIGRFRLKAAESVKILVDDMLFSRPLQKYLRENDPRGTYYINNMWVRFGGKLINQEFLGLQAVSDVLYVLKKAKTINMTVPISALIKYRGYKAICIADIPINQEETVVFGLLSDATVKNNSLISDNLKDICQALNMKPYLTEIRATNVLVYLDYRAQVHQTHDNPFADLYAIQPRPPQFAGKEPNKYYLTNLKQIFPVDIDLNNSINQSTVRLRPELVHSIQTQTLSSGAFLYNLEDQEGQNDDLMVADASARLRAQVLPSLVKKLDRLDIVLLDSRSIQEAFKSNGVNMRYLGKIVKMTQLPYVRELLTIEIMARVIKKLFRNELIQFHEGGFRNSSPQIFRALANAAKKGKEAIPESEMLYFESKKKEVLERYNSTSRLMVTDFMNLVFSNSAETEAFWQIIKKKCKEEYLVDIEVLPDVTFGALLHAVLYHCGLNFRFDHGIRLFNSAEPFKETDFVDFTVNSRVYQYPSFELQKLARQSVLYLRQYQEAEAKQRKMAITAISSKKDLNSSGYSLMSPQPSSPSKLPNGGQPSNMLNQARQNLLNSLNLQLSIQRALKSSALYQHCALPQLQCLTKISNYTTLKMPEYPPFHPAFIPYCITHLSEDNFSKAHAVAEFCMPITHPLWISFYIAYSEIHDKATLYKSALIVAIRGLGLLHWKTCELFNLMGNEDVEYLKKAWVGSKEKSGDTALLLVQKLYELGNIVQCAKFCERGYQLLVAEGRDKFEATTELLIIAVKCNYDLRQIKDMFVMIQRLWKILEAYENVAVHLEKYYLLLWYTVKGYYEKTKSRRYIYRFVLKYRDDLQKQLGFPRQEEYFPPAAGQERVELIHRIVQAGKNSKSAGYWVESNLNKLDYGFHYLDSAKDFYTRFEYHVNEINNEELNQGISSIYLLCQLFGQKFFEEALITDIFADNHVGSQQKGPTP